MALFHLQYLISEDWVSELIEEELSHLDEVNISAVGFDFMFHSFCYRLPSHRMQSPVFNTRSFLRLLNGLDFSFDFTMLLMSLNWTSYESNTSFS